MLRSASAVWALLAVVAQQDLHEGAMGYGVLNGCIGLGAVLGASSLPKLRRAIPGDVIATAASVVWSTRSGDVRVATPRAPRSGFGTTASIASRSPRARIVARSITLASSRTLPGHS